jgi:starch synthase (maltosyl-transferring)
VNRIRHDNPALHSDRNLRFHSIDNENVIAYSKTTDDHSDSVLAVVNLDPHHSQSGWLELDLETLGLPADQAYQAHDLLSGARFLWKGARNYVSLDTQSPAHLFRIRRKVRTERDFDYFL